MKPIFDRQKRHSWSGGSIIQCCLNHGCRWRRTQKSNARGETTSVSIYSFGQRDFEKKAHVPPCGSSAS